MFLARHPHPNHQQMRRERVDLMEHRTIFGTVLMHIEVAMRYRHFQAWISLP